MTENQVEKLLEKLGSISDSIGKMMNAQEPTTGAVSPEEMASLARMRYEAELKSVKAQNLSADLSLLEVERRKAEMESQLIEIKEKQINPTK
jgi:hypothetical protein